MRKNNNLLYIFIGVFLIIILIVNIYNYYTIYENYENYENKEPTFHIIIATGGRPSLKRMLDSLKGELTENDAITIIFDGPEAKLKSKIDNTFTDGHSAKINLIEQNPNLGFWGHGIRNKYQGILEPKTTYIMNADDDDTYISGSFNRLRNLCKDPNKLYIARMDYEKNPEKIVPSQNKNIIRNDIGTPNGIIPFKDANKGKWGYEYGGDFMYYDSLIKSGILYEYLDITIYRVK